MDKIEHQKYKLLFKIKLSSPFFFYPPTISKSLLSTPPVSPICIIKLIAPFDYYCYYYCVYMHKNIMQPTKSFHLFVYMVSYVKYAFLNNQFSEEQSVSLRFYCC